MSAVSLAAAQNALTISLVERTLLEREQLAWKYLAERKIDDYARMLGKDFQGVYGARVTNRNLELVQIKTHPYLSAEIENLRAVFPAPEMAIVTADIKLEVQAGENQTASDRVRSTAVYVKRGIEWQIVYRSHFSIRD